MPLNFFVPARRTFFCFDVGFEASLAEFLELDGTDVPFMSEIDGASGQRIWKTILLVVVADILKDQMVVFSES